MQLATFGTVLVECINLGALHQAQQNQELTPCSSTHANLIQAICQVCCSLLGITIHFKHVKGHHDDLHSASSLPHLANLTSWQINLQRVPSSASYNTASTGLAF